MRDEFVRPRVEQLGGGGEEMLDEIMARLSEHLTDDPEQALWPFRP